MLESQEWLAGAHREASDMGRSARSQRVALRARHARPPPHRVHFPSLARCEVDVRVELGSSSSRPPCISAFKVVRVQVFISKFNLQFCVSSSKFVFQV